MKLSIATVSLSGGLAEKLDAIAAACRPFRQLGFQDRPSSCPPSQTTGPVPSSVCNWVVLADCQSFKRIRQRRI